MKKKTAISFVLALVLALGALAASQGRQAAPDFSLKDQNGRVHALKKLRGRVVVADFGRVNCIPCRSVLESLGDLHSQYARKGVSVLSVNLGASKSMIADFVKEKKLKFPILDDPGLAVARSYGVQSIPYVVLIDKQGRVCCTHLGYTQDFKADMEARVKKLLAEEAK